MKFDQQNQARINIGSSGNNTIISSPGPQYFIQIDHLDFICTNAANTISIQDNTTVLADYPLPVNGTYSYDNTNQDLNTIKLSVNSPFIINLSGGLSSIKGMVIYRTVGL